ncbi:MAG: alpha-mannosidase [Verrucomicrobia bacterium]|nr:alpha-mannosidase [Verrucomicrobiota bacterium]
MLKHPRLTETRIERSLERLATEIYPERLPIQVEAWHVGGEPVSLEMAMQGDYRPFSVGEAWGPAWDTSWFRVSGQVPSDWDRSASVVLFQLTDQGKEGFTAEGLVYQCGRPVFAINRARNEIDLTACLEADGRFSFYIEAAANWAIPDGRLTEIKPGPLFFLVQAELALRDDAARALYFDFQVAAEAMSVFPENSQRRAELRCALNAAANHLDAGSPERLLRARAELTPLLARRNGETVHRLSAIGHAHIDTAWLWPLRETMRKCARTFSTAVAYMDRYPEYIFGCSQAQQYAWMKAHYPEIYAGIVEKVRSGQWEPIGSMWVEVDCNLASGESLIRQILYGKKFFREEFGVETRDAWVPDVFGYSAAMPQILKGCGIDAFVTQKISWSQFNRFPHQTFLWEGLDGTRIFTHFPPADTYLGIMNPRELMFNLTNFQEHGRASRSLYIYGHGDGGGGPDIPMLERARRLQDFEGLPQVRQEKVSDFLPKAIADAADPAVWVGELYLELHRGTYTTHGATKRGNRKSEYLLRDTEFAECLRLHFAPHSEEKAVDPPRAVYDVTGLGADDPHRHAHALERAWKLLLLNQFHDIIPGSSIRWVYEDSARDYAAITALGQSVLAGALDAIDAQVNTSGVLSPVRLFNPLGWERREVLGLPSGRLREVNVPACGYAVVSDAGLPAAPVTPVTVTAIEGGWLMENGLLRLTVDASGSLTSVWDVAADREVLAEGACGNEFHLHPDQPNVADAWDIDIFYKEQVEILSGAQVTLESSDPWQAALRVELSFGASRLTQRIVLTAGSRRVDFPTEVDWHESHRLLKVAFPVGIHAAQATYETQFGHLQRPTHYNTTWDMARFEVCAHKWADLSEGDYGVALLNDCKYGYDIHGCVMRLSLLRSPTAPDPVADRGRHHFTYALLPHAGDFRAGRVVEEAYELNGPLHLRALESHPGALPTQASFFSLDRPGLVIDTIKPAEDGEGIIVRLYESRGSRGRYVLRTSLPAVSIAETNLLEVDRTTLPLSDGEVSLNVRPFEILTLRLRLA